MDVRTCYALGIVTLFSCLKDPYSEKGYGHFFDSKSNEGYIAWKLKNMQCELCSGSSRRSSSSTTTSSREPSSKRGPQFARSSAEENPEDNEESSESAWDSDMAALLLLVYLLPPPPSGKKRAMKMTVQEALSHVVRFHKSCHNLQETTSSVHGKQPYILAVGTSHRIINDYYIVVDSHIIPWKAKSSNSLQSTLCVWHLL
ncbi:hypothetical protein ILYODFUR_011944 [Ilyodon furcidens]|uniref:Uncharacterized protein n=1 Tax=Ilyodon furcidens TaxID=33524 RepID=A0ABV0SKI2_9TELE